MTKSLKGAENDAFGKRKRAHFEGIHPAQLGTVYGAMSQSGAAPVKERFVQFGINASEHMPLVFTLTKNAETGAITVRYSEPEGFPVHFHWENTIATDGTSVVTEMVIEQN